MGIAKAIPIKIAKISEKNQEKILDAESTFLKNVKAKKLKFETHGHIPYGSVYHRIEDKLELHEKHANSDDAKVLVRMIGKSITLVCPNTIMLCKKSLLLQQLLNLEIKKILTILIG